MKIGYGRVSTEKQDASKYKLMLGNSTLGELDMYFDEVVSTKKKLESRLLFTEVLPLLKDGDILVVYNLSRLDRGVLGIHKIFEYVKSCRARIFLVESNRFLGDDPNDALFMSITSAMNQFTRDIQNKWVSDVLQAKKAAGQILGRPCKIEKEKLISMLKNGERMCNCCKFFGVTEFAIFRYVKRNGIDWKSLRKESKVK